MNRLRHTLPLLLVLVLAACQKEAPPPAGPPAPTLEGNVLRFAPGHPQLAQLGMASARAGQSVPVDLPARLVWNEERTQRVYPAFAGRVLRIEADLGQAVKPGAVLARLASPDFAVAQAETAKAQVDARLTQKTLQRQQELFEAGIVARKDVDQAEAEAARSQAEIQRAQARTRLYGRGTTGAVDQQLALTASIGGVVVERNLTPGQELRPDQAGVPPLFVVSDPTSLWVLIDARESEVATLRPGATFELQVPTLPGQKFEGRITATSDFIDPATRTVKVRGVVPNPDRKLKAEMLAQARFERALGSGVLIPAQAVALRGVRHFAMVQTQPGSFEVRDVVLGYQGPREVLVTSGLEAGEQVVTENMLLLARQYRLAREAAGQAEGAAGSAEGRKEAASTAAAPAASAARAGTAAR